MQISDLTYPVIEFDILLLSDKISIRTPMQTDISCLDSANAFDSVKDDWKY
jgi:hypothetical protein